MIGCRLATLLSALALPGLAAMPCGALADRFAHVAPLEQKPSGNYYLEVNIAPGVTSEFLVDTGSGYVVLTKATFDEIQSLTGARHLRDITGRLANGKTARARVYRLARLELATDCVLDGVEVAVMPGVTRNILGLSALRQVAPFAMELNPPALLLSGCAAANAPPAVAAVVTAPMVSDATPPR